MLSPRTESLLYLCIVSLLSFIWQYDSTKTSKSKQTPRKNGVCFWLYTITAGQWIFENADCRRFECEQDKEQGDHAKRRNCRFWCPAGLFAAVQPECFVNIDRCGGNEENGNVDFPLFPIILLVSITIIILLLRFFILSVILVTIIIGFTLYFILKNKKL